MELVTKVNEYIDAHKEEIISLWKELVNMEGKTEQVELVNAVGKRILKEMQDMGMVCTTVAVGNRAADSIIGIYGQERKAKPIIFGGHMDTVFKKGEFLGDNPFKIEDGKAHGPGVLDMKGGIVMALYIIKALTYAGYDERPLKIILSGDEEGGHAGSQGQQFFLKEGAGGLCAFNMETGPVNNCLCTGRSTSIRVFMDVEGVEAHSGNNYTAGKNAIVEAAHKLIEMQNLTSLGEGTTVNTGIIKGGTVVNAVAGRCQVDFDFRFKRQSEIERVLPLIDEVMAKTNVEGTKTHYRVEKSGLVLYIADEGVNAFFNFMNNTAKKYGYPEFGQVKLGGASDAGSILVTGTPVICSCGVRGEWNHTLREYAVVDSMYERAKLYAAVICELTGVDSF